MSWCFLSGQKIQNNYFFVYHTWPVRCSALQEGGHLGSVTREIFLLFKIHFSPFTIGHISSQILLGYNVLFRSQRNILCLCNLFSDSLDFTFPEMSLIAGQVRVFLQNWLGRKIKFRKQENPFWGKFHIWSFYKLFSNS